MVQDDIFALRRRPIQTIESIRVGLITIVLFMTVALQNLQPQFVNLDVLLPVYLFTFLTSMVHVFYVFFIKRAILSIWFESLIFAFDAVFVTALIFYTGLNTTVFLFLYMVNIILCGLVFRQRGAILLALWTSILWSGLIILTPTFRGQSLYLALGLNNIAFIVVAYLAGYLSEQLNFMGIELRTHKKDLRVLRDINQSVIENISTGILTTNMDGKIGSCNPAGWQMISQWSTDWSTVDDLVGGSVSDVFSEISEQCLMQWAEPSLQNQCSTFRLSLSKKVDDQTFLIESVASPLFTEGSPGERRAHLEGKNERELAGYIILFQDLTEMKRLEAAMRRSEKLAAVGQLAAGIAHEIRNPLASISGSIQLMADDTNGSADQNERLMKIVIKEINRLNLLITDFLDFAKPDSPIKDPIPVNSLIQEIMDMVVLNKNLRADVEQQIHLYQEEIYILGDRNKLKQALLNIIINGYQAMTESPKARLRVQSEILETSETGSMVQLRISDSGCGMSAEAAKKIFEPFHTTKVKGTGLGLAVTHKILESHGALIFVESEEGVGTEFLMKFPRYVEGSPV